MKKYFTKLRSSLVLIALGITSLTSFVGAQSFTEGFDDLSTLNDWLILNNSTGNATGNTWAGGSAAIFGFPEQAGVADSYLEADYTSSGTSAATDVTLSNWLFTPARTISNGDVISFYTRTAVPGTTPYPDRLEVRMSTGGTDVGTTATSVGDFTILLQSVNPTLSATGYPTTWTQYTITISGLAQPTTSRIAFRYFVTDGGPGGTNSTVVGLDSYSYTSVGTAPANDNCAGAINLTPGATCTAVAGNVNFATQSQAACGDGTANDDVWYKFTATTAGANVTVDGSADFDGVMEVFSGNCGTLTSLGCTDASLYDGIETTTLTTLVVGQTYYIRVFDWYETVAGSTDFTICVTEFTQCALTQPLGSILETETCGADLNGGCNMVTPAYQTLTCGQTVFGSGWNNGTNKDTDWYTFTITTPGTAIWTATAEFPFAIYFINNSNCTSPVVLASVNSSACASATVTYNFTAAGTYVAFISPSGFSGYACGTNNDYIATLTLPSTTPVITATGSTAICTTGGSVALSATGTGTFQWFNGTTPVGTGTSTYTATAIGSYTVQVTNASGCPGPLSTPFSVTAAPLDDATFTYPSNTICNGSANVTPTTVLAGTFSATPAGLVFVSTSTGEIDVAGSTTGTYTVTYNTNVACANSSTQTVTVTSAPLADFSYADPSYCAGGTNPLPVFVAGSSAGTFTSTTGLAINSGTGEINLAGSTAGTYTVTNNISASGSCPSASATTSVSIVAQPTAVVSGGGTICNATGVTGSTDVTINFTGTAPYDFTYTNGTTPVTVTGHGTNSYTISTSVSGTYSVTSVSDANCSNTGSGTATVSVFQNPTVTLTGFTALCSNAAPVVLTQGSPAGGTYSGTGVTAGSLNPAIAPTGTVITYAYTDANGCSGTATAPITITTAPTVTFSPLSAVCSYVPAFALTGGSPAGGTYAGPGITGGNFNPATAGVGTHTVVYSVSAGGCTSSATQTIIVKNCAGLEENELGTNLVVYPNPANDNIVVSFNTGVATAAQISLVSLDGKTVYTQEIPQSKEFSQEINVADFPGGVYLIRIKTTQGSATRRLVIQ